MISRQSSSNVLNKLLRKDSAPKLNDQTYKPKISGPTEFKHVVHVQNTKGLKQSELKLDTDRADISSAETSQTTTAKTTPSSANSLRKLNWFRKPAAVDPLDRSSWQLNPKLDGQKLNLAELQAIKKTRSPLTSPSMTELPLEGAPASSNQLAVPNSPRVSRRSNSFSDMRTLWKTGENPYLKTSRTSAMSDTPSEFSQGPRISHTAPRLKTILFDTSPLTPFQRDSQIPPTATGRAAHENKSAFDSWGTNYTATTSHASQLSTTNQNRGSVVSRKSQEPTSLPKNSDGTTLSALTAKGPTPAQIRQKQMEDDGWI